MSVPRMAPLSTASKSQRWSDLRFLSFSEQRRIVARVNALFVEIDEGEAALAVARKELETFRRALLKAAVTGELTKDWRAANSVSETGHDVFAQVKHARATKVSRKNSSAEPIDMSQLPKLPHSWAWATVRELADVIGGLTKNPDREKMPFRMPYLRVANVQTGKLDLSEMKEIGVTDDDRRRAALEVADLLIVEGNGSIDQIGRCAIWNGEIAECVHQNHIIKVRFSEPDLSRWCLTWLLSPHGREEIERVASSTSGLHTLSISKIGALPIPVPPLAEISEILRRVLDGLTARADTLALLDAEAADSARLKQSILKAAFEGRLVPQDSADEPASVLLARASDHTVGLRKARGRIKTRAAVP
jgi:type I restriction enzyme, S subunit